MDGFSPEMSDTCEYFEAVGSSPSVAGDHKRESPVCGFPKNPTGFYRVWRAETSYSYDRFPQPCVLQMFWTAAPRNLNQSVWTSLKEVSW